MSAPHPSSIQAPDDDRRRFWDDLNSRYWDAYDRLSTTPFFPRKDAAAAAWAVTYGEHFQWVDWRGTPGAANVVDRKSPWTAHYFKAD